jgi:hypothetical protein
VEDIVDYNIVTSRRGNVPSVVEFRVRWKGACDDSWHEPKDFEHSQDTLVSFLQKLTKSQRIKVLKTVRRYLMRTKHCAHAGNTIQSPPAPAGLSSLQRQRYSSTL